MARRKKRIDPKTRKVVSELLDPMAHGKKLAESVLREPVNFNYTGLNWDFLKLMAEIVPYADAKYTSFAQYTHARLEGEKSPANHMAEHLRQYMMNEPYDHFDGDRGRHLAAIAYNAMMEWYYLKKFGGQMHPLKLVKAIPKKRR